MIRVSGLSFAYGSHQVLHDISFTIAKGELISVLGMNGSGKSTLLKNLCRLLRPQQGTIHINNQDMSRQPHRQLAQLIGYLPQSSTPLDCSVFEAVLIGRKPYLSWQVSELDLAETTRMLELTGLSGYEHRSAARLSGGELQRVAIARTLAQQPSLLLLDEPVNHLDIRSQLDIMALIRRLTSQLGIVTIAVMHDLNTALRFSDGFLMLKDGKLLAAGGPKVMTAEIINEVYQLQVVQHELGGIPMIIPCPDQEPSRASR